MDTSKQTNLNNLRFPCTTVAGKTEGIVPMLPIDFLDEGREIVKKFKGKPTNKVCAKIYMQLICLISNFSLHV